MTIYYLSKLQNTNVISLREFEEKLQVAVEILGVVTLVFVFKKDNSYLGTLKLTCNASKVCPKLVVTK